MINLFREKIKKAQSSMYPKACDDFQTCRLQFSRSEWVRLFLSGTVWVGREEEGERHKQSRHFCLRLHLGIGGGGSGIVGRPRVSTGWRETLHPFHQSHSTAAAHSVSPLLSREWFLHLNLCIFYTKQLLNTNQHPGASLKRQNLLQHLLKVSKGHFDSNFLLLRWL